MVILQLGTQHYSLPYSRTSPPNVGVAIEMHYIILSNAIFRLQDEMIQKEEAEHNLQSFRQVW